MNPSEHREGWGTTILGVDVAMSFSGYGPFRGK